VHPLQPRDQGDLSWCYGHAAADYLQFHYRIDEPLSAADIAIRYNERTFPRLMRLFVGGKVPETGFIRTALRITAKEGFCPESSFPSDYWKKVYPGSTTPRIEMKRLGESIGDLFRLHHWVQAGVLKTASELPFYFEFKAVSQEDFFELLRSSRKSEVLGALRNSACKGMRKNFERPLGHISMGYKAGSGFRRIHQALERGVPVAADFFYGLLDRPRDYSRALRELHTALVMGQRFSPQRNECEYLIKDSYGSTCGIYSPEWDCESGSVWVGESAFRKALVSTVIIDGSSGVGQRPGEGFESTAFNELNN
jgi:hypothetical protein